MMKSSLIYNMLLLAKAMATDAKMISLELEQVPIMEYSSIYANRHLMQNANGETLTAAEEPHSGSALELIKTGHRY